MAWAQGEYILPFSQKKIGDIGRMANLRLVDKQGKELVELKLQVLVEVRTSSGWWSKKEIMSLGFYSKVI